MRFVLVDLRKDINKNPNPPSFNSCVSVETLRENLKHLPPEEQAVVQTWAAAAKAGEALVLSSKEQFVFVAPDSPHPHSVKRIRAEAVHSTVYKLE